MAPPHDPTLAELGEGGLIERLAAYAAPGQFADDAALLPMAASPLKGAAHLVMNTDLLVEGVHFSTTTTEPFHVGWRAAAANLSDLAAMGCESGLGVTVGLVAPPATRWSWVAGVYEGLSRCLAEHGGGALLGGDCSRGRERSVAVAALGPLPLKGGGPIRRGDGRAGDVLVCTGLHGLSRLGLALLQGALPPGAEQRLKPDLQERAVRAHQLPVPRFDAVRAVRRSWPPGRPWRVGGTDSSDGLAAAVLAVATASGCGAVLEQGALPIDPAMAGLEIAQDWCLAGGEDFELVLALEPPWAEALLMQPVPGLCRIGELTASPGPPLRWADGRPVEPGSAGFSHFMAPPGAPPA